MLGAGAKLRTHRELRILKCSSTHLTGRVRSVIESSKRSLDIVKFHPKRLRLDEFIGRFFGPRRLDRPMRLVVGMLIALGDRCLNRRFLPRIGL